MADLQIIRAGLEHLDLLGPLFSNYRAFYEQKPDKEAERSYLTGRLADGEAVVFLALAEPTGGPAAGFVLLYPSFDSVELGKIWILHDLYVDQACRHQGIGRRLMEIAHDHCRSEGATRIDLDTAVSNREAQPLYESLGYERDNEFFHYSLTL